VLGGLVAATVVDGRPLAARLALDPGLVPVLLVPERALSTEAARAALPATVPLADAAFTAGRTAVLIAALADRRLLRPELMADRLHQDARAAALYPEAPALLAGLVAAGASGACWSGAGPSLLALCDGADVAGSVRSAGERLLAAHHLGGRALVLDVDTVGLVVEA
jgi:homoserine kinase